MKTCIQIGLWQTAECLYLANKDVPSEACGAPGDLSIPEEFEEFDWQYFGIDGDPNSIATLANRFPIHPYVNWINAHIVPNGVQLIDTYLNWCDLYKQQIVSVLGTDLTHLFHHLNITSIDLLVMDIEGAEWNIFKSYDWVIKPKFMIIEFHKVEGHDKNAIDVILQEQGYKNIFIDYHGLTIMDWVGMHAHYKLKE